MRQDRWRRHRPQTCNHGFDAFALDGDSLWLGEVQYAVNQGKHAVGLPGVYKLGAWHETADFADQHWLGAKGNVLTWADGSVTGPLNHSGDWGVYGVADQIVWRGEQSSLNLFVRGPAVRTIRSLSVWPTPRSARTRWRSTATISCSAGRLTPDDPMLALGHTFIAGVRGTIKF